MTTDSSASPSHAAAPESATPAPDSVAPLRWGILGAGGIAETFAVDLITAGLTVQAVGSRSYSKARTFAAELKIPTAHGSYQALVDDPEVDIIYVATPHSLHSADALLAIEAGKHVLVEKAFTQNAAQAREVAEAAHRKGVFVMEAMWTRFLPTMVEIRRLIAEGALGEVQTVIADHNQKLSTDPNGRLYNPSLAGGALLDLGIYPVSFAVNILGLPTEINADTVKAVGSLTATGVDRQFSVALRHPGAGQSLSQSALDQRGPNTAVILGTAGRIEIDSIWFTEAPFRLYDAADELVSTFDQPVESRGMQYEAFEVERCVRAGLLESPQLPLAESITIMEILDEIRRQIGVVYPGE